MAGSIALAGTHQVDGLWPRVAEGLERACLATGGDMTAEYLWSECRSGRAFLVIIGDCIGASVWRFEKWATGRKLRCLAVYGADMPSWLDDHRAMIEQMAKVGGATAIVAEGRTGWARLFPEAVVLRQLYEVVLK